MTQRKHSDKQHDETKQPSAGDAKRQGGPDVPDMPKTESSSEYEGAADRKNTGNQAIEVKTETSSSSGQ